MSLAGRRPPERGVQSGKESVAALPKHAARAIIEGMAIRWRILRRILVLLAMFGLMGLLAECTGMTLGLFLGGLALAAMLLPYALLLGADSWDKWFLGAGVIDGVGLFWLVVILLDGEGTVWQWIGAYGVLLAVCAAQAMVTLLLARVLPNRVIAAGLGVGMLLVWLGAPVWLSHHLSGASVQRMVEVHPLFAINGVIGWSVWTEAPLAYRVLNLNQDVYYALPSSPLACILLHSIIAAAIIPFLVRPKRRLSGVAWEA